MRMQKDSQLFLPLCLQLTQRSVVGLLSLLTWSCSDVWTQVRTLSAVRAVVFATHRFGGQLSTASIADGARDLAVPLVAKFPLTPQLIAVKLLCAVSLLRILGRHLSVMQQFGLSFSDLGTRLCT